MNIENKKCNTMDNVLHFFTFMKTFMKTLFENIFYEICDFS